MKTFHDLQKELTESVYNGPLSDLEDAQLKIVKKAAEFLDAKPKSVRFEGSNVIVVFQSNNQIYLRAEDLKGLASLGLAVEFEYRGKEIYLHFGHNV